MTGPGRVASWRAAGGIKHRRDQVSLGYRSAFSTAYLSRRELGHHGLVVGSPGSGKTTAISLIVQGHERLGPCIILDAKGSRSLARAVVSGGGLVWTIGGRLKLDLLDPDPTTLADQLTEATRYAGPSEVFAESAAAVIQWIGHVLRWEGVPPTLELVETLLEPGALALALKRHQRRPRVPLWQTQLAGMKDVQLSGVATALMRVGRMIDSTAGPSLGTALDAIRLEDVVTARTTLLISLGGSSALSRTIGGWALLAMQRACLAVPEGANALMVVDEIGALEGQARHVRRLLTLGRECGVGVVIAAHGPAQLDLAVSGLASEILQETAWQVVMAQGDPDDADRLSRLFPLVDDDKARLGKYTTGTPTVTRDHLRALGVGECAFTVRAVDGGGARWGFAKIAMPEMVEGLPVARPSVVEEVAEEIAEEELVDLTVVTQDTEDADAEERRLVYSHVKVVDGWRVWRGNFDKDGYPRQWMPKSVKRARGGYEQAHKLIYLWEGGEMQPRWELDHECGLKDCLDHLKGKTKPMNLKNRDQRARGEIPTGHAHLRVEAVV